MKYYSTRDTERKEGVTAAFAIKNGLAPDGGLYMPDVIPGLTADDIENLCGMDYAGRAADILSRFLPDYTKEELLSDCRAAYGSDRFDGGAAPLARLRDDIYVLELWHGPTGAFKDMALQIMPRLLSRALEKTGEKRTALILVATSGDTGKAALEGYRDVPGVKIAVFYPVDGVSRIQKLQMATQEGENVYVCAVKGNFDDAQNGVKRIFSDREAAKLLDEAGLFLSSANSINWGRLAPQIAYYVSAYCDLCTSGRISNGELIDFCVPTGNFGNIFAGYIAKQMGLPVRRFICASNTNNVLTDFFATGTYDRNRTFHTTMSPSMDILISSNLERLLSYTAGAERTRLWMKQLSEEGRYTVDADIKAKFDAEFTGCCCSESDTAGTIKETYEKYGYLSDTHTACALYGAYENSDGTVTVCDSTASPYKFAADVLSSLGGGRPDDAFEAFEKLNALTGVRIPESFVSLRTKPVRFERVIEPDMMLREILGREGL